MGVNTPTEIARGFVYDRVRKEYARLRARSTGGWVLAEAGVEVCACPFVDLFNGMISPCWPDDMAEVNWRRAVGLYQQTGQDMYVSLGPSSRPASLEKLAQSDGFRKSFGAPFMYLDLDELRDFPRFDGVRVERIERFSFFDRHEHPWLGPVNTPYRDLEMQFLREYGEADSPRLWQFVALNQRKLAGAVTLFTHGQEVAVFDVVVDRPHRRKGIGTRLVGEACQFAREMGMRSAGLGASGEGAGLYQKLGFIRAGVYCDYYLPRGEVLALEPWTG